MEIYQPTNWSLHPLHLAVMSANLGAIELIIAQGAYINENIRNEGTPLHLAVKNCEYPSALSEKIVKFLLKRGADASVCKTASGTPLHLAAQIGNVDVSQMLIDYGADVNSKSEDHFRTPLHYAAYGHNEDIVNFLISVGAEVDAVADMPVEGKESSPRRFNDWGMTPLHIAAREGHDEIVRCLVAAGASLTKKVTRPLPHYDFQGATALDLIMARRNGLINRLKEQDFLLKELGASIGAGIKPLHYSSVISLSFRWTKLFKGWFQKNR